MKAICDGRDDRYYQWPDVSMDGTTVKRQRQSRRPVRDARQATEVLALR